MLTPPDRDLVRRDPELPGMRLLLEPAALLGELAALGLTGIVGLEPVYTRYKPQQSLLTTYRVTGHGEPSFICAKAHREDARSKLAAFKLRLQDGPGGVIDALHTAVYPFHLDRKLTHLPALLKDKTRATLLKATPFAESARSLTHLRYKPERRYVAKLESSAGPVALVKHYTAAEFSRAAAGVAAFQESETVRLAPTALRHDARLSVASWRPGVPLDCLEGGVLGATEAAGRALRSLHAQAGTGLAQVGRGAEVRRLQALADTLSLLLPKLEPAIRTLAGQLCQRIGDAEPCYAPLHGDFSADQVLACESGVIILDFDNAHLGDPAADLGSFGAQLEWDALACNLAPAHVPECLSALHAGYGEVPPRSAPYTAAALLRLAPLAFRKRRPDWPAFTEALLARAERYLTS